MTRILTLLAFAALALIGGCALQAAPVPITPNQFGIQNVQATSFPYLICPGDVNGCGGSFTENIGTGANQVSNANIWCVDSQLDVTRNESYTASIVSLKTPAASFDNGNLVRYGNVTTWTNSLGGYGLSSTDALTRYRLASILLDQYVATPDQPANNAQNKSIQNAIWELTENGSNALNLSSVSIATNVPAGYTDWIAYASHVLNQGNFNYGGWAVVSGGYDTTNNTLFAPGKGVAVQTFLVQVTPEPSFYGILLLGLAGLFIAAYRRTALNRAH